MRCSTTVVGNLTLPSVTVIITAYRIGDVVIVVERGYLSWHGYGERGLGLEIVSCLEEGDAGILKGEGV